MEIAQTVWEIVALQAQMRDLRERLDALRAQLLEAMKQSNQGDWSDGLARARVVRRLKVRPGCEEILARVAPETAQVVQKVQVDARALRVVWESNRRQEIADYVDEVEEVEVGEEKRKSASVLRKDWVEA